MRSRSTNRRFARWALVLPAFALVAAACGGDDDTTADEPPAVEDDGTESEDSGSEPASGDGDDGGDGDDATEDGSEASEPAGGDDEPADMAEDLTLTVGVVAEPLTLDPQHHRNRGTQIVSRKVHDNLVYLDPLSADRIYVWKLATGAEQVDDLTWDVFLREGVEFHDGYPFNSESVLYTYERLFDEELNSPRATMGSQSLITEIEAIDDYTVRFHTSELIEANEQGFPIALGLYSQEMLRPGIYDGVSLEEAATMPTVGTGPWKFVEWEQGQYVRFERNDDYWDGPPQPSELVMRFIPESSTLSAELITASVDLIYPVDSDTMAGLAGQDGIEVTAAPGTSMTMLQVSVQEGRQFADLDLRLGLNAAIDRNLIVDNLFQGFAVTETQMTPRPIEGDTDPAAGYDQDSEGYQYDPDLARELLAPLAGETIELHSATNNLLMAEVVAEQLRQVGLDVEVIPEDPAAMSSAIDSGEYDIWIQAYGGLEDIGNNWDTHFSCATNEAGIVRTGYCNPEQDARMEEARGLDEEEREQVYSEIGKELNANPPWVPLWTLNEIAAYRDYVSDFVLSPVGQLNLWNVKLNK